MAPILTAVIPMQLVCNLVAPSIGNVAQNVTITVDQSLSSWQTEEIVRKVPEGYIAHPDIGMAYKIHNENVTRAVAKQSCINEGGRLAVVDSRKKHDYIKIYRTFEDSMHVGISKFEDSWINVSDGSPVFSLPWGTDQPEAGNNCAYMSFAYNGLAAYECIYEKRYVCEFSLLEPNRNQQTTNSLINLQ